MLFVCSSTLTNGKKKINKNPHKWISDHFSKFYLSTLYLDNFAVDTSIKFLLTFHILYNGLVGLGVQLCTSAYEDDCHTKSKGTWPCRTSKTACTIEYVKVQTSCHILGILEWALTDFLKITQCKSCRHISPNNFLSQIISLHIQKP